MKTPKPIPPTDLDDLAGALAASLQRDAASVPVQDAQAQSQFLPTTPYDLGNPFIGNVKVWPATLQVLPAEGEPGDPNKYVLVSIRYGMVSVPILMTAGDAMKWGKSLTDASRLRDSGLILP